MSDERSGSTGVWAVGIILAVLAVAVVAVLVVEPDDDGAAERAEPTTLPDRPRPTEATTSSLTTALPLPATTSGQVTWVVGQDLQPDIYFTSGGLDCHWERRRGIDNGFNGLLASAESSGGQQIVEIVASDVALMSSGCPEWVPYVPPPTRVTSFGAGDWIVGDHIPPGVYRTDAPSPGCILFTADGLGHDYFERDGYSSTAGPEPIEVHLTDDGERFTNTNCGTWHLVG